jgi:hypothetical protein
MGSHARSETSMRKLLALGLGASLLVVGTGAVLAQSAPPNDPAAKPAASAAPSAGIPSTTGVTPKVRGDGLLDKVLKDLVTAGTLDQAQADAITARLNAERDALRADLKARREAAKAVRQQIREFLKDGVITADELAQLPADNPLRNLDKLLDDGKITLDELRQLGIGRGGKFGFGERHGPKQQENAAPSPSTSAG